MKVLYVPESMEEMKIPREERKNPAEGYVKNEYKEINGHFVRGLYCDPEECAGVEAFCLDVGVCNICGQNMYDFITALGSRLKCVILRDNDGDKDNALLPFTSVNGGRSHTDWLNLIRGLRKLDFDGTLVIDFTDSVSAMPLQMKEEYFRLAHKMGAYLEWQIGMEQVIKKYKSRVLFGAGNMCRAYMKCYGEEFAPLFTCDNNKKLWNTQFEGLTVKSPEALRELPEDCAVFICNVYYDEIEAQLKEMGLPNPIERFNDEFMPSFYFDRFDAETRTIKER